MIPLQIDVNSITFSDSFLLFAFSLKTNLMKFSFCCVVMRADGKPSCANKPCNHLAKLSQYFLFKLKIISLNASVADRGVAPPKFNKIRNTNASPYVCTTFACAVSLLCPIKFTKNDEALFTAGNSCSDKQRVATTNKQSNKT